jgi:hypothetical protein
MLLLTPRKQWTNQCPFAERAKSLRRIAANIVSLTLEVLRTESREDFSPHDSPEHPQNRIFIIEGVPQ